MSGGRTTPVTEIVDVGTPPNNYSYDEYKSFEVHFHGFANLPSERGNVVESPEFSCFGHRWKLEVNPGGHIESSGDNVGLLFLVLCSQGRLEISYCFSIDVSDGDRIESWYEKNTYQPGDVSWGGMNFATRSKMMDALVDGTLVVENILKKFMDEETADVVFEVGSASKSGRGARKKAKTALATFYAHRLILQDSASTLAELAKSAENMSPIQITDVAPEIFYHMLYYVYGGEVSEVWLTANAKNIIDAADKYGIVNLKLEAEACYARSVELTVNNALDTFPMRTPKTVLY